MRLPTARECRERAAEKLAQAAQDDNERERLLEAAEAWLLLAQKVKRGGDAFQHDRGTVEKDVHAD